MAVGVGKNTQGIPEDAPRAWRRWSRRGQNFAAILWPAFLAACLATGLFFSQVDPVDLLAIMQPFADLSGLAGYAVGFFFFWFVCSVSSWLSVLLIRTSRRQSGEPRGPHH